MGNTASVPAAGVQVSDGGMYVPPDAPAPVGTNELGMGVIANGLSVVSVTEIGSRGNDAGLDSGDYNRLMVIEPERLSTGSWIRFDKNQPVFIYNCLEVKMGFAVSYRIDVDGQKYFIIYKTWPRPEDTARRDEPLVFYEAPEFRTNPVTGVVEKVTQLRPMTIEAIYPDKQRLFVVDNMGRNGELDLKLAKQTSLTLEKEVGNSLLTVVNPLQQAIQDLQTAYPDTIRYLAFVPASAEQVQEFYGVSDIYENPKLASQKAMESVLPSATPVEIERGYEKMVRESNPSPANLPPVADSESSSNPQQAGPDAQDSQQQQQQQQQMGASMAHWDAHSGLRIDPSSHVYRERQFDQWHHRPEIHNRPLIRAGAGIPRVVTRRPNGELGYQVGNFWYRVPYGYRGSVFYEQPDVVYTPAYGVGGYDEYQPDPVRYDAVNQLDPALLRLGIGVTV